MLKISSKTLTFKRCNCVNMEGYTEIVSIRENDDDLATKLIGYLKSLSDVFTKNYCKTKISFCFRNSF